MKRFRKITAFALAMALICNMVSPIQGFAVETERHPVSIKTDRAEENGVTATIVPPVGDWLVNNFVDVVINLTGTPTKSGKHKIEFWANKDKAGAKPLEYVVTVTAGKDEYKILNPNGTSTVGTSLTAFFMMPSTPPYGDLEVMNTFEYAPTPLDKPEQPTWTGNVAHIKPVAEAVNYKVNLYNSKGTNKKIVYKTSSELAAGVDYTEYFATAAAGTYTVTVAAMPTDGSLVYATSPESDPSAEYVIIAKFPVNTPAAVVENGVTATCVITPAGDQAQGTPVTATVTLSGTATAMGTHTIKVTSAANVGGTGVLPIEGKTIQVVPGAAVNDSAVFTFTMPNNAVSDLILINHFVQAEKLATPNTPTLTASPDGLAIKGEWQKVDKATSYEVQLYKDGTAIAGEGKKTTDQLSCDFAPIMVTNGGGSYTVDVKAIGDGRTTLDSEKSPQSAAFVKKATQAGYFSIAPQEYTGSALTADIKVTQDGSAAGIVNVADQFTVTNNTTTEVSTPAHKVTLSPKSGSHFVGEVQLDFTVTQKPVTITGITATAKAYDGTNNVQSASFSATGGVIAGKVVSDDVSVDVTTATGTTPNKNVGENIPVTMAGVKLGGTKAGNYTLSAQPTDVKIKVTAIDLTVEGLTFADKVYDGTADATISGTPTLAGVIAGDAVALKATDVTKGTFASSDAAKGITVNLVTPMGIEGADIGNYNLIAPVGKAAITAQATAVAPMTVELKKGNTAQQSVSFEAKDVKGNKVAGSWTLAADLSDSGNIFSATGKAPTIDTVTGAVTFALADGFGINKTATQTVQFTPKSTNYMASTAVLTVNTIDKIAVTISGVTAKTGLVYTGKAQTEVYTGTPSAAIANQSVAISKYTYMYKASGAEDTTLTATVPTNAGSYLLVVAVADTDADYSGKVEIPFTIGQKEVSVMGYTAVNREYDGTTKVTIDGSKAVVNPADIFGGDEVKVADGAKLTFTGTVKLPAANTAAAVTVVNTTAAMLDGAQGANYKLSAQPFQQVMAVISQRPLTVSSVTVADKEYDGTTKQNSAVTFTTDKVAVDDLDTELKITYEMTYDNKDAGANNKTAHFTNLGIQGTSKDNYTLKTKAIDGKNCTITKKAVTVSPVGVRAYVGDAKPTTTLVYNGFIGTDNESVNTGTKCSFTFAPEPGSTLVKNDDRAKISAKLDGALAQNYTFVKGADAMLTVVDKAGEVDLNGGAVVTQSPTTPPKDPVAVIETPAAVLPDGVGVADVVLLKLKPSTEGQNRAMEAARLANPSMSQADLAKIVVIDFELVYKRALGTNAKGDPVTLKPGSVVTIAVNARDIGFDGMSDSKVPEIYHCLKNGTVETIHPSFNRLTNMVTFQITSFSPFAFGIVPKAAVVTPTPTPAPTPKAEEPAPQEDQFWSEVHNMIHSKQKGTSMAVDAAHRITMPGAIINDCIAKGVTLTIKWDGGKNIVLNPANMKNTQKEMFTLKELVGKYTTPIVQPEKTDKEEPAQTASPTPSPTPTPKPTPTPTVAPTPTEEPVDVKGEKKGFPWLIVVGVAAVVGGGIFWVARKKNSEDEE